MAKKVLNVELNYKSVMNAVNCLYQYEASISKKVDELIKRLSDIGVNVIDSTMMNVPPVDRGQYSIDKSGDSKHIFITLSGDQVLFIEYSAGITFGTNSFSGLPNNPNYGSGMGVGTYPGQTHAEDPEGWYYKDRYGQSQHTYGIRAYQPMFNADMEMRKQIVSIAKEVFK